MKTIELIQGTPEWAAHRATALNASDAPVMFGVSPYRSRQDLIRERATGIVDAEIDPATAKRFADGHRAEALARPLAEKIVGEELFPVTGVSDDGKYSASFDGLTMLEDTGFEHKTLGESLRYTPWDEGNADHLPEHYRIQMEQQCMVSGCERILFMASRWAGDGTLLEERHCWYAPDATLRQRIVSGWTQFEHDVVSYVPDPSEPPKPTGRAPETLPALRIEVTGAVTASNLSEFKASALAVLGGINRDLQTDADFSDAEQTVKWCGEVESRIKAAKENALAQTASIEEAFRAMDDVSAEVRRVRLDLDKLVKAEKDARRMAIVRGGADALQAHVKALNERLGSDLMPGITADFGGAVKGLKSIDSMKDAVATALANAKIEASAVADRIQENLAELRSRPDMAFLFPDTRSLVQKAPDDLRAVIATRISEHQARERARQEDDRERIRAEEQAKAETAALERALAQPHAVTPQPEPQTFATTAAAANELAPDTGARMTLGQINTRIAPLSITVAGLNTLGFQHVGKDKAAFLFRASDFALICEAIAKRALLARTDYLGDAARSEEHT